MQAVNKTVRPSFKKTQVASHTLPSLPLPVGLAKIVESLLLIGVPLSSIYRMVPNEFQTEQAFKDATHITFQSFPVPKKDEVLAQVLTDLLAAEKRAFQAKRPEIQARLARTIADYHDFQQKRETMQRQIRARMRTEVYDLTGHDIHI